MAVVKGAVVRRLLKEQDPPHQLELKDIRRLLVKHSNGKLEKGPELQAALKKTLKTLKGKGTIARAGKTVTLVVKDKKAAGPDEAASKANMKAKDSNGKKRKREAKVEDDGADTKAKVQKAEAATAPPAPTAAAAVKAAEEPAHKSKCTRLFLGNLSFKIDDAKLHSSIPGITHIKVRHRNESCRPFSVC